MANDDHPRPSRQPAPGDIISSPLFAQGHVWREGRIWVGEVFGDDKLGYFYDPERGQARFVVEDAFWTEPNLDGVWEIHARLLTPDGQAADPQAVDPMAPTPIAFYMRADYVTPFVDEVTVHGRMRRLVTFLPLD